MDPIIRAGVARYLDAKCAWSSLNDTIMASAPRLAVPRFATPQAAADYYFRDHGNPYTGDPWKGIGDHYLNPQRLQAALASGPDAIRRMFIDCDDVAGWYLHATAGIPGLRARLITLVDLEVSDKNGCHVALVGSVNGRAFGLDTNGYRDLPDDSEAAAVALYREIFAGQGFDYVGAVDCPYPFTPTAA